MTVNRRWPDCGGYRLQHPVPQARCRRFDPRRQAGRGGRHNESGIPNIAFVLFALPGTAGPGTIAMIISAASTWDSKMQAQYAPWVIASTPSSFSRYLDSSSGFYCVRPGASSRSSALLASRLSHGLWAFCWCAWACNINGVLETVAYTA